jgi:hypothetical protein|nr:MAG TPA: hypothetical protein [Caudoviricetes sp.]
MLLLGLSTSAPAHIISWRAETRKEKVMNAYIVRTAKDKKEIKRFDTLKDAFEAIERYEERDEKAGTFTKWAYEVAYEGTWYSVADIDIRKNGETGDEELLWIGDNEQEALEAFERLCWENRHNMKNRRIELRKMDYDPRDPERCIEGYDDLKKMEG